MGLNHMHMQTRKTVQKTRCHVKSVSCKNKMSCQNHVMQKNRTMQNPCKNHVKTMQNRAKQESAQRVRWRDAVVEGEALAAGVGHCVVRPGGPQQLLVLQPHAVVQPHSVRLHFRHGHKDPLGYLPAGPHEAQPRPHPHALRAVLCCSLATPIGCYRFATTQIYVDDLCLHLEQL